MRPERILAALLAVVAAGLVGILILGPTEGAKAKADAPRAATPAPTTTAPTTTASTTTAATTTEPEPEETVETEPEPTTTEAEPPPFEPGDGTFPRPVTISLYYESEINWETHQLRKPVGAVGVQARATAVRGMPGDVHGLECGLARSETYTFLVDPWTDAYTVQRTNPVSLTTIELESGQTDALLPPPRPNVLSLACVAHPGSTSLSVRANGKLVTSLMDQMGGRLNRIGVTAWSPQGGQKVVFDAVTVDTGGS